MIDNHDLAQCRAAIRAGSHSFYAASTLLPAAFRDPALALYAFCRLADDAVDEGVHKSTAVTELYRRLDRAYAGRPENAPADRALAALIETYDMPRALPEALLEGLTWDAMGRRYDSLGDVRAYAARVAAAVGAMMCVLMGVRDRHTLARACDLGVAMQLTNIARDVGEDARAGRLYLPIDWFAGRGIDPETFLSAPMATNDIRDMVARLLAEAARLYRRADPGIRRLPFTARPGIFAARYCYNAIGRNLADLGHDSILHRAFTTKGQKMRLLGGAMVRTVMVTVFPETPLIYAKPLPETTFLVEAATTSYPAHAGWGDDMLSILTHLTTRDRTPRIA